MTADAERTAPPFYRSPARPASLWAMIARGVADPASVIPKAIYHDWALKLPGPGSPVVVVRPESVREVLLDKGDRFGRNRQLRMLMRRAWNEGLAASEGESWAQQRRAASPAFRPPAVEAAADAMARVAGRELRRWPRREPVELGTALGRIVTEVVMATLLSGLDDVDIDALAADIPRYVRQVTSFGLLDVTPLPDSIIDRLRGIGRSDEVVRLRALAARLASARSAPPDRAEDLPALLRGAGPLADNILGFMLAGFETTALGAAWAAYLLALNPDWQQAVRAEGEAAPDGRGRLDALPTARLVAQEALRLYPPAPLLVRAAVRRTELEGFNLRPGQPVIVPVYAIHRHRLLWEGPDLFDPKRFDGPPRHDRAAYLPFGAGPRLCIAASFALAEISVIISELTRTWRLTPTGPAPEISLKVATSSRTGLHVLADQPAQ